MSGIGQEPGETVPAEPDQAGTTAPLSIDYCFRSPQPNADL